MSPFEDSEIGRGILESLLVGLCVVDMQKKSCSGATARNASPATSGTKS